MIDTAAIRTIIAAGGGAPIAMSREAMEALLVAVDRGQAMEAALVNVRTISTLATKRA